EERSTAGVEVVEMMVVAQQHGVHATEGGRWQPRSVSLPQHVGAGAKLRAGRIERRIAEQAQSAELQQDRGAADVGQAQIHTHESSPSAACRPAEGWTAAGYPRASARTVDRGLSTRHRASAGGVGLAA